MSGNSWQHIRGLWRAAEDRPVASRGAVRVLRRHFAEPRIVERMAVFEDFIRQTERQPFVWGVSDCSLMVADWCVANGHTDPATVLRGSYATESECRAMIGHFGDLAALVASCAQMASLRPIHEPEFGCAAVIGSKNNPNRQWSAIWNGCRWAVRWHTSRGVTWQPFVAPVLGMWRV